MRDHHKANAEIGLRQSHQLQGLRLVIVPAAIVEDPILPSRFGSRPGILAAGELNGT